MDEPMCLGQARPTSEYQLDALIMAPKLSLAGIEVAEMVMRNLEFAQSFEELGDVNIFFGGLYVMPLS